MLYSSYTHMATVGAKGLILHILGLRLFGRHGTGSIVIVGISQYCHSAVVLMPGNSKVHSVCV